MSSIPPRSRWQEATIKIRVAQYFNEFVEEETSNEDIEALLKKFVKKNKKEFKLWDYLAGIHGEATVLHYSTRDAFLKHMEFVTKSAEEQQEAEEKAGYAMEEAEKAEQAAKEAEIAAKEAENKMKAALQAKKEAAIAMKEKALAEKKRLKQKVLEMKKQKMAMKAEARKEIALARKKAKDDARAAKYHAKHPSYLLAKQADKAKMVNAFRLKLWESIQAGWTEDEELTKAQKDLIHKVYYHRAVHEQVTEEVEQRVKYAGHLLKKGGDSGDKDLKERYFIVEDGMITYTEPHKVTKIVNKIDISRPECTAKLGAGGKEIVEKSHIHYTKGEKFTPDPETDFDAFDFEQDEDMEDDEKQVAAAIAQKKAEEESKEKEEKEETEEEGEQETEVALNYAEIVTPDRTFWVYSDNDEDLNEFIDAVKSCSGKEANVHEDDQPEEE